MNTMYHIKTEPETGRGLYANHDIAEGKVISSEELLVLSPEDTKIVNLTILNYYTFKYNDTQDCLVLGDGELYNHKEIPNVEYKLVKFDGRLRMYFVSLKEIKQGEQLFIDYTQDEKVDASTYTKNAIG